ncbi:MAG: alpha-1,2-fucosyltransferase [Candidatus Paceibacterota bacterium]|jgi:hypothetical protein
MIIVNLKGGLGNQMFQYALGRRLALVEKQEVKFDTTGYNQNHYRSYGLGIFKVKENFATATEIANLKYPWGLISKIWRLFKAKILRQNYIGWVPSVFRAISSKNYYLDGYWQSYKYFEKIRETLLEEFSLKTELGQTHPELLAKISEVNSVSLSVRRTDYLWPVNLKSIGVCSVNYYKKAIELIESKVADPVFFVFGDDLDWAKANILTKHQVFYISELNTNNPTKDYQELVLVSHCKHNIIANSSFSWWPAWLNQNPDKIVIAPDTWLSDGSIKINDIVPSSWIKLPRN